MSNDAWPKVRLAAVTPSDTHAAGFWTSADDLVLVLDWAARSPDPEARRELLAQCSTDEERAAMLAGSIEVME